MKWRHSGFSIDNGLRISRNDEKGRESIECIKKIWEVDPLLCPHCGGEMKIISFITEASVIRQILEHLNLWEQKLSRDPPEWEPLYENIEVVRESFDDGWGRVMNTAPGISRKVEKYKKDCRFAGFSAKIELCLKSDFLSV